MDEQNTSFINQFILQSGYYLVWYSITCFMEGQCALTFFLLFKDTNEHKCYKYKCFLRQQNIDNKEGRQGYGSFHLTSVNTELSRSQIGLFRKSVGSIDKFREELRCVAAGGTVDQEEVFGKSFALLAANSSSALWGKVLSQWAYVRHIAFPADHQQNGTFAFFWGEGGILFHTPASSLSQLQLAQIKSSVQSRYLLAKRRWEGSAPRAQRPVLHQKIMEYVTGSFRLRVSCYRL